MWVPYKFGESNVNFNQRECVEKCAFSFKEKCVRLYPRLTIIVTLQYQCSIYYFFTITPLFIEFHPT
jgi:hypothetical protein